MRTRLMTQLTNFEVEQYLEHNDLIFIPVGTVELARLDQYQQAEEFPLYGQWLP